MSIDTKRSVSDVDGFNVATANLNAFDTSSTDDLGKCGLIYSDISNTVGAAVFTLNDVKGAPVVVSQSHLQQSEIKRAVFINAKTANVFTGKKGLEDAYDSAKLLAKALCIDVNETFIASTGCIGFPLPMTAIKNAICDLSSQVINHQKDNDFASVIMTTDTRPKQGMVEFELDGKPIQIAGVIKGAGMIMPNMATMLCTLCSNVAIDQALLQQALNSTINKTLNCSTVDGDTSTSDSVFLLANGKANNSLFDRNSDEYEVFEAKLTELLTYLTKEMIQDGEGIEKFIELTVKGVPTEEQAKKIGLSIANSPLVKTAMFGEQLNWGRILMAAGKAQTGLQFDQVDLTINGFKILEASEPTVNQDAACEQTLSQRNIQVELDLNQGDQSLTLWTTDFSYEYVKINADYLT